MKSSGCLADGGVFTGFICLIYKNTAMIIYRTIKLVACAGLVGFYSSVLVAGDLGVEGTVTATTFVGNGAGLTGVATTHFWVPKTGQSGCWDEDGDSRTCTGTGEDREYQMGSRTVAPVDRNDWQPPAFWANPRFTDNVDGTVTDNLTGLIWLKNANCTNDPLLLLNKRRWEEALAFANNLANGLCGLTDDSSAGDWRLPNFNELLSLTDPSQSDPALSPRYPFSGVRSSWYWSSTTDYDWHLHFAWVVNLYDHSVTTYYKTDSRFVWPVRGGQ